MDVTSPVQLRHDSSASIYAMQHNFQPDLTMHAMSHVPSREMCRKAPTEHPPGAVDAPHPSPAQHLRLAHQHPPWHPGYGTVGIEALLIHLMEEQRRQQRFMTIVLVVLGGMAFFALMLILLALWMSGTSRAPPSLAPTAPWFVHAYPPMPPATYPMQQAANPMQQAANPMQQAANPMTPPTAAFWASRAADDVSPESAP
jgi:Na+-transporting methylmalonyl-CoA/oxaloacetate decarboxylase gamma subunit